MAGKYKNKTWGDDERHQVITYLTPEEKVRLKEYCYSNKTSVSNYLRNLILNNYENKIMPF